MINTIMKTFKEYLSESKKVYGFKIKIAGDLPENFQDDLKKSLTKHHVVSLDNSVIPVEESSLDFPEVSNKEINVFDLVVDLPITAPEIVNIVKEMGIMEECLRVRGSGEPIEFETKLVDDGIQEPIKHKEYFGDDFNKSFLKDLEKTVKERSKEGKGLQEYEIPNSKQDKSGISSPVGSK
jgi:hypothetical protein